MLSRNSSQKVPKPCKHLVDYKLNHGQTECYNTIRDMLTCTPYGMSAISETESSMHVCSFCSSHKGSRFFMCLICSSVTCYVDPELNHALSHNESFDGHEIHVDMERAELYCTACSDQVYDPDFDKVVVSEQVKMLPRSKNGDRTMSHGDSRLEKRRRLDFESNLDCNSVTRLVLRRNNHRSKSCGLLGLRGLNNLGSTCFMNSVLQAVLHAPPLRDYFLNDRHNHKICRRSSSDLLCLPCDLDVMFSAVYSGDRTPYSPAKFLYSWWQHSENLASYEQQDAHEFFISMLDRIHEKLGKDNIANKGNGDCHCIAHSVFSGVLRSDVTCTSCGFTSSTYDPCVDISLELNMRAKAHNGRSTLTGCLDLFTRPEKLGPDQKLYCEKCHEKQNALKQMSLNKLPSVLCLHIKRFEHSPIRKMSRKIDIHLQFPFSLDVRPYMSSSVVGKRFGNRILETEEACEEDVSAEFEVFAVVTHSGMLESGHYVTYLRSLSKQWYKCDDAWITQVDEEVVRASQCYLIFYVQKLLWHLGSEDMSCQQPIMPLTDPFVPIAGCC